MSNEEVSTGDVASTSASDRTSTVDQRRERLAQLIGRLLARTWLKQRRESSADSQSSGREIRV